MVRYIYDSNGVRAEFSGTGHDTGDDLEVALAIMNHKYDYDTGYIRKNFDYQASAIKGTKSGLADQAGEVSGGILIKEKLVYKNIGTLAMSKYVSNLGAGIKFGKKALGLAGTIGFTGWDVGNDLVNSKFGWNILTKVPCSTRFMLSF